MQNLQNMLALQGNTIINTQSGEVVARFNNPEQPLPALSYVTYPVLVHPNLGGFVGVTGHDMATDSLVVATPTALEGEDVEIFRGLLLQLLNYQPGDEQPQIAAIPSEVHAVTKPVPPEGEPKEWTDEENAQFAKEMAVYEKELNEAIGKLDAESAQIATNRYTQFVDFLADLNASLLFRVIDGKLFLAGGIKRSTGEPFNPAGVKEIADQYGLELSRMPGFAVFETEEALSSWLATQTLTGTGVVLKDAAGKQWLT